MLMHMQRNVDQITFESLKSLAQNFSRSFLENCAKKISTFMGRSLEILFNFSITYSLIKRKYIAEFL